MSNVVPFEEDPPRRDADGNPERLVVDLGGFEGPIDVLLQLARDQKVDITQLSILSLAEQYLVFVREARRLRLELAADYLVMAAWLAYLKSRLLLPEQESREEEPSGAEMAAALRFQLQRLQAMQDAGKKLMARPRLGREVFARGEPMEIPVVDRPVYACSLYELLQAYARQKVHHRAGKPARRSARSLFGGGCARPAEAPARRRAQLEYAGGVPGRPVWRAACNGAARSPRPSPPAWKWSATVRSTCARDETIRNPRSSFARARRRRGRRGGRGRRLGRPGRHGRRRSPA